MIGCTCEVCKSVDFRDNRLRASVIIQQDGQNIVIDTGPDFRQQMLRERISSLNAVVYTHEHKDHTAGMDDVRSFNFIQKSEIPIYARKPVIEQLKREYEYVFAANAYPGVPKVRINEITTAPFQAGDISLIPIEVMHHKLPVLGYRVGDFTYITDANYIAEEERAKIKGSKVLVLNALRKSKHISHFNLEEAIQVAGELGVKTTYLTHISHDLGKHQMVADELPDGIRLAYDGLKIEI